MPISLERLCNDLNRNGFLPPADIRNLRSRWLGQAGASAGDPVSFANWLFHHRLLTDYQANVLLGRRDGPLALGPYKIRSRINRGRLARVYEASDPRGQAIPPPGGTRSGKGPETVCLHKPGAALLLHDSSFLPGSSKRSHLRLMIGIRSTVLRSREASGGRDGNRVECATGPRQEWREPMAG